MLFVWHIGRTLGLLALWHFGTFDSTRRRCLASWAESASLLILLGVFRAFILGSRDQVKHLYIYIYTSLFSTACMNQLNIMAQHANLIIQQSKSQPSPVPPWLLRRPRSLLAKGAPRALNYFWKKLFLQRCPTGFCQEVTFCKETQIVGHNVWTMNHCWKNAQGVDGEAPMKWSPAGMHKCNPKAYSCLLMVSTHLSMNANAGWVSVLP